jgi:hypothetical protein
MPWRQAIPGAGLGRPAEIGYIRIGKENIKNMVNKLPRKLGIVACYKFN